MRLISIFLIAYGVLALSHIALQMFIGHLEYRRQARTTFRESDAPYLPSVSVIIPAYNEDPAILRDSINSVTAQDYPNLEVLVVDDGSTNIEQLRAEVYDVLAHPSLQMILVPENAGKRQVQKRAFDVATGEIFVTIDSDTILRSPNAVYEIVQRLRDPEVGATTGDVRVSNNQVNLLTRLIGLRYWTAFHQERAAQSYFNVLMCCSGPFSAYRASAIEQVKTKYVTQTFLGRECTFGDDRHLTNLVLNEGYEVVFDARATAYTEAPETVWAYVKQQIRWNKSFYREMLWTYKSFHKHHWYMLYDLTMQLILPFLLLAALAAMIFQSLYYQDPMHVVKYFCILVAIALLRAAYGAYRTRDAGFALFVAYGFMHVFVLIPTRLYALMTINRVRWGTR